MPISVSKGLCSRRAPTQLWHKNLSHFSMEKNFDNYKYNYQFNYHREMPLSFWSTKRVIICYAYVGPHTLTATVCTCNIDLLTQEYGFLPVYPNGYPAICDNSTAAFLDQLSICQSLIQKSHCNYYTYIVYYNGCAMPLFSGTDIKVS